MTIHSFIKKRSYLIWWTRDFENLSEGAIVEAVLNYGDWGDIQKLIKILGIKKVAKIFRKGLRKSKIGRCNYRPEVKNYFSLYFKKYASS